MTRKLSRREALVGLAALGTLALPAPVRAQPSQSPDVVSLRVPKPIAPDPEAVVWRTVRPVAVALVGQAMVLPTKMRPSVPQLAVRSAHDGEHIAFLLGGSVKRCVLCHQAATSWVASTPSTYRTPA